MVCWVSPCRRPRPRPSPPDQSSLHPEVYPESTWEHKPTRSEPIRESQPWWEGGVQTVPLTWSVETPTLGLRAAPAPTRWPTWARHWRTDVRSGPEGCWNSWRSWNPVTPAWVQKKRKCYRLWRRRWKSDEISSQRRGEEEEVMMFESFHLTKINQMCFFMNPKSGWRLMKEK